MVAWNGPGTFSWTSTGLTSRGPLEQPWRRSHGSWSLGLFWRNWTFPMDVDRLGGRWNGTGTLSWTSTDLTSRGLLEQPWARSHDSWSPERFWTILHVSNGLGATWWRLERLRNLSLGVKTSKYSGKSMGWVPRETKQKITIKSTRDLQIIHKERQNKGTENNCYKSLKTKHIWTITQSSENAQISDDWIVIKKGKEATQSQQKTP